MQDESDIFTGLSLEEKGDIDGAINLYKTMISKDKNADFAFTELFMLKNKYSRNDVLTYFDNIPANNKHYALASKLIADNDLQNNRFDDAIGIYDKLISNYPKDYQGINAKFEELFAYLNIKNDKTKATQMLSDIKAMNLTDPEWEMRTEAAEGLLGLAGNSATKNQAATSNQNNEINNPPKEYALFANYPNPFNPSTIISYQIPKDELVTLKVFDALGREVKTLVNEFKFQGKYSVSFDASKLASGVYFYQLRSGDFVSIKKMILLK
ncbi:MAG: T9SS type A sorting domain-containing protein [Ignavibacteriaceae bacterium]